VLERNRKMGAKKFFRKHFSPKEADPPGEGDKGKKDKGQERRWEPMRDDDLDRNRAESSLTGSLRGAFRGGKESKFIKREGEVAKYVPEEFHNRKLLGTMNERSNCGIHAILISARPDLSIEEGVKITNKVRSALIQDRNLPPADVMPNKPLDLSQYGGVILDKMSKHIGEERGLIIHYSHGIGGDDHQIVRGGKEPINIYLDKHSHYWGMGPEIEPRGWKPNPATSGEAIAEASLQAEEERLFAEVLERSMREQ
jgi:hypothetical protein